MSGSGARSGYAAMHPKTSSNQAGVKRSKDPKPPHTKPGQEACPETAPQSTGPPPPTLVVFWKPEDEENGFLSQWYTAAFSDPSDPSVIYPSAAHYKTYQKALLFDPPSGPGILEATTPGEVRALGRQVANFDESVWAENKVRIVTEGNRLKFTSPSGAETERLRGLLLATGDRELVAASQSDRVWGIGFDAAKAATSDRKKWGKNLLGKALTTVRAELRAEEEAESGAEEEKPEADA